jgi:hypothetical protein
MIHGGHSKKLFFLKKQTKLQQSFKGCRFHLNAVYDRKVISHEDIEKVDVDS